MDAPATPTRETASAVNGKFRRNGKLQSCEPCRKSKLRCDHVIPACGRCVQKSRVDQCVYHPHPLTGSKPARQPRRTPTRSTVPTPTSESRTGSVEHHASTALGARVYSPQARIASPHQSTRTPSALPAADTPRSSVSGCSQGANGTGYLGATSYSSIFSEGLGNLDDVSSAASPSTVEAAAGVSAPHGSNPVSPERLAQSRRVLSFLRDRVLVDELTALWYRLWRGTDGIMLEPIMKEWLRLLWAHHGDVLARQEQDPEGMDRLVRLLWANTQAPMRFGADTSAIELAQSCSGPGIRWEVVGIIAGLIGSTAVSPLSGQMPPELSSLNSKTIRDALVRTLLDASTSCLEFCREFGQIDDLFVGLVCNHSSLVVDLHGIMSHAGYRSVAEAVDAVVSLGWHTGVKADEKTPFFLTEVRKRIVVDVYSWEIGTAAVLGRPPRVSHRYWTLNPPLDLTDAQVVLQGEQLQSALAGLDAEGYSNTAHPTRATFVRTRVWFSPRREDILDLALGNYSREEVLVRAQIIQEGMERGFANMPSFAQCVRGGKIDLDNIQPLDAIFLIAVIQGIHVNEMMLQRVLIRQTGASSDQLINTARQTLKDIMTVTQRHDIQAVFQGETTAILAYNGLRAAGIVAVELLKQEQLPAYPEKPLLPRSQTIQDLAVFAARLGTVEPTQGFYKVCSQGRKYISLILDKLLSPKPPQSAQQARDAPPLDAQSRQSDNHTVAAQMRVEGTMVPLGSIPHSLNLLPLGPTAPSVLPGSTFDLNIAGFEAFDNATNDYNFGQWLETMDWERTDG